VKFGGENWQIWSTRAKLFFIANYLWGLVSCDEKRLIDAKHDIGKGSKKDEEEDGKVLCEDDCRTAKALSFLVMAVTDSVLMITGIGAMSTAWQAWWKLEATYAAKTLMNRLLLLDQFASLRMTEGDSVQDFINEVKLLTNQVQAAGDGMSEEQIVLLMLKGLPGSI